MKDQLNQKMKNTTFKLMYMHMQWRGVLDTPWDMNSKFRKCQ